MAYFHSAAASLHARFDSLDCDTKKKIVKVSACVIGVIAVGKVSVYTYKYMDERRIRQKKLNQTQTTKGKLLQKLVGLKTPIDNRDSFTSLSYEDLREQLRTGKLQAVDLLEAHQARALEVDRTLNCITDIIYDADVTALYLDSLPQDQRGRLHGIPLSVKECVSQANYDSYFGCVSRCFHPEKETTSIIEALEKEGMVPFARTTMSQNGSSIACDNPLFGETLNPHNTKRTSGGSSGGEGALIGGRGSIAGIGTDIGGSIRIPSSYCGVYGLKPTCERIGRKKMPKWKHGLKSISYMATIGPISRDFDLLVDITRVLFSSTLFDLDSSLPRLHFDNHVFEKEEPMTIGYYKSFSDNYLTLEPAPSVQRAVEEAKMALESRGHTLVEWEPPRIAYGCDLLLRCLFADGGENSRRLRKDELLLSGTTKKVCRLAAMNPFLKILVAALSWPTSPLTSRFIMRSLGSCEPYDILLLMIEAKEYKAECGDAWDEAKLDGLICPVVPFTAPLIGDTFPLMSGALYCNMYNFLDYPAGVVPVTRVTEDDCSKLRESYPRNNYHGRKMIKTLSDSVGMPVGVQCVAKKWKDEKTLCLMKELKKGLNSD